MQKTRIVLIVGLALFISYCSDSTTPPTTETPTDKDPFEGGTPPAAVDTGNFTIKYKSDANIIKTTTVINSLKKIDKENYTYTFKSDAAEIAALKKDDVILLPALIVGKVVSVTSTTDEVVLVMTPVPITEVVTDINTTWDKTVSLANAKVNSTSSGLTGQKKSALDGNLTDANDVNAVIELLTGINPEEYIESAQQIVSGVQWLADVYETGDINLEGDKDGWAYSIKLSPSSSNSMSLAVVAKHEALNSLVTYNGQLGMNIGFRSSTQIVNGVLQNSAFGSTRVAARGVIRAVAASSGTHQTIFTSPTVVKIVGLIGMIPIEIDVKLRVRIITEMLGEASADMSFDTWLDLEAGMLYEQPGNFQADTRVHVASVDVINFALAGPFGAGLAVGLETPHMTVKLGGSVLVSELWMGPGIIGAFIFSPACMKSQALIQAYGSYEAGVLGHNISSGSVELENRGETYVHPGSQCPTP
jgi:hypothetical protein